MKLNLTKELVNGKRVIVVDDSLVRGTTAKSKVHSLKEAGATEVHMLISCPPHMHPCLYGIDFPNRAELMAANFRPDEICTFIGADSLHYLSTEGMVRATGRPMHEFCLACWSGVYPTEPQHAEG